MQGRLLKIFLSPIICMICFLAKAQNDCPTWEWAVNAGLPSQVKLIKAHGDTAGNMYMLGSFQGSFTIAGTVLSTQDTSHFIAKYSKNQAWSWAVAFDAKLPGGFNNFNIPLDFHFEEQGYITVAGIFTRTATFGSHTLTGTYLGTFNNFVARFNINTQQWLWAAQAESPYKLDLSSIAGGDDGNLYIAGAASIFPTVQDTIHFGAIKLLTNNNPIYIAKIDSSGTWLWAKNQNFTTTRPLIAVDNAKNPMLATNYKGVLNFAGQTIPSTGSQYSLALLGYTSSGQESWVQTATGVNTFPSPRINYLDFDAAGNLYISGESFLDTLNFGTTTLNANPQLGYIAKLNPQRQWTWAQYFGGQQLGLSFSTFYSSGITLDNGNSYFSGIFNQLVVFGNDTLNAKGLVSALYICKMDSAGNYIWGGAAYSPNGSINGTAAVPLGITVDLKENVYIAGVNTDTYLFGNYFTSPSGKFVAKFKRDSIIGLSLPKDTTLYCGDSIKLVPRSSSVSQLYYRWSPGHGLSDSTAKFPYASPDSTTTYTLDVYTSNGCVASDKITIGRDSVPWYGTGIPLTTSTGNKVFCNNSNFSISGPTNYQSYKWSTGSTTFTTSINQPGTYVLTAKDENGCYKRDSIIIVGPVSITPKVPLLCANDSVAIQINPQGLDSLRWNNGSTYALVYASQAGKYWVTVHKGNCTYTDTIVVQMFTDTANATFSTHIVNLTVDFKPNSIGIASGRWDFGDGVSTTGITASHTYATNGLYNVCFTATDICGIQAKYCDTIKVPNISIEELPIENIFSLFPNPATGIINIESTDEQAPKVQLTNLSGKVVLREKLAQGKRWQIDIHHLPSGYYFINIAGSTFKLVKM